MSSGVAVEVDAARHRFVRACVIGAGVAGVVFLWMLAIGRLDLLHSEGLGGFYDAQAHALLGGHWDIPAGKLGFEAFLIDGKAYMYFGPWPAILRLPIAALTDQFDGRLTQLSIFAAFVVLMVATSRLLWRVRGLARPSQPVTRREAWAVGGFVAVVGAGSVALFLASRPVVYHEAALWGAALSIAAFEVTLAFIIRPRARTLAWAGVLTGVALLSRGSVAIGPVVALALVLAGRLLVALAARRDDARPRRAARALGLRDDDVDGRSYVVPLLAAIAIPLAVYMYVNYAKFGHLWSVPITKHQTTFTDEIRRQIYAANDGSLFALKFIPTDVVAMFRPDAIALDGLFPFVTFPAAASVVGSVTFAAIDPSSSIPSSMPFLFLLSLVGVVAVVWPRRNPGTGLELGLAPMRVLAIGGLAGGVGAVSLPYINQRYAADFLPLLVVVGAAGLYAVLHGLELLETVRRPLARALVVLLVVLGAFSLWANFSLALLYQRAYSPFPSITERAAFVRFQHEVDDLVPGGSHMDVRTGPALPDPLPIGTVFVVGDCEGVYWSDGLAWTPIEQTHATGLFPIRVTFRDQLPGTRETLLVAGPADADDRVGVRYGRDHHLRLTFDSTRLGRPIVSDPLSYEPGRPSEFEVRYDAPRGEIEARLDGQFGFNLPWAAYDSAVAIAGDGTAAGDALDFSGRARLEPAPARFCRDLVD